MDKPQQEPGVAEIMTESRKPGTLYARSVFFVGKARLLWRRRVFFLKRFLVLVAISVAIVFLWPKHYAATTTLMPPSDTSVSLLETLMSGDAAGGAGAGSAIGSLLGLNSQSELFVRATESRTVADRMIQRFDLMKVYHDRHIEDCRKNLKWFTDVEADEKSGTIDITVTDKDPRRAAEMANAYVDELNRLMLEINQSAARQERDATSGRVEAANEALEKASKDLAEYASKNAALAPDQQAISAVQVSAAIEGQLIVAKADLKSMEQLYTPGNPRVYSARAEVNELQEQLDKANSAGLHGENTNGSLPSVRELPLLAVKYLDLYRTVQVDEEVLKVLTEEYELARIREHHDVATVSVMDTAVVPTKKSFPPRALFLLGFVFISFWLVTFWVLLVDWWQTAGEQDRWKRLIKNSAN